MGKILVKVPLWVSQGGMVGLGRLYPPLKVIWWPAREFKACLSISTKVQPLLIFRDKKKNPTRTWGREELLGRVLEEGAITAVVANNQPLGETKDLQQAIGKRYCRNLSTAMLQWCMENMLVLFPGNASSPATQGAGFTFNKIFHVPRKTGTHPAPDCGIRAGAQRERGSAGSWCYQQWSSPLHCCACLGSCHTGDTSIPMFSKEEWNVGCFWGTAVTLPKTH